MMAGQQAAAAFCGIAHGDPDCGETANLSLSLNKLPRSFQVKKQKKIEEVWGSHMFGSSMCREGWIRLEQVPAPSDR